MAKVENLESTYKIKRFMSSTDRDFIKALKIYNATIPVETKTSTNEIIYYLDSKLDSSREMYFLGLYLNEMIIGYIQAAYLSATKVLAIDYLVLQDEYNINGVFYPLFSLFQQFISESVLDVDYILIEISMRTLEENVDRESYYLRKLLISEDFRIVDALYPQPLLGLNNYESNLDLRIMIKSIKPIMTIKASTYLSIVEDIYINHYLDWYGNFMNADEIKTYNNHLLEQLKGIKKNLQQSTDISLRGTTTHNCDHYMSNECFYKTENLSTAGYAPTVNKKTPMILGAIGIPLIILLSMLFSLIVYWIFRISTLPIEDISPLFTAISATLTGVIVLLFSKKK